MDGEMIQLASILCLMALLGCATEPPLPPVPKRAARRLRPAATMELVQNAGAALVLPLPPTITITWDYPATYLPVGDFSFRLYHTFDLALPLPAWPLLTNLPASARRITLPAVQPNEFFALSAKDDNGESFAIK